MPSISSNMRKRSSQKNSRFCGKNKNPRSHRGFLFLNLWTAYFQRWMQPAQQQGLRFPSISSARVLSIRRLLVSGCLADSTQQIHSLRASGVISSHASSAFGKEVRAFRKSIGTLCATPVAISPPASLCEVLRAGFLVIGYFIICLNLGCLSGFEPEPRVPQTLVLTVTL